MPLRIDDSAERLVVRDTPWGLWTFGAVFVTSGLATLSVPLLSSEWSGLSVWQRLAVLAIGAAHLAAGLWTIGRHAATVTQVDRATGDAVHVVRRPFERTRAVTDFHAADVRTVALRTSPDSDGDPMYALELWLSGSRVLPLQAQPAHGRERAEERATRLRAALGLPAGEATTGDRRALARSEPVHDVH